MRAAAADEFVVVMPRSGRQLPGPRRRLPQLEPADPLLELSCIHAGSSPPEDFSKHADERRAAPKPQGRAQLENAEARDPWLRRASGCGLRQGNPVKGARGLSTVVEELFPCFLGEERPHLGR